MTIKNTNKKNVGTLKKNKMYGKKMMVLTALLSGGVTIRVDHHLDYSFGNQSREVVKLDLVLETTDVLINDEGIFYVGQGTPINNFEIEDFVEIHDSSGEVITNATLDWDVREYFTGDTFGEVGRYMITIKAHTPDGRRGEVEYILVVKEGHIFNQIKEFETVEVNQNNTADLVKFQEHFQVLDKNNVLQPNVPISSTLEDEDLRSIGEKQVIFWTELNGVRFTNSVDISVVDTIAPIVQFSETFESLEGFEWSKEEGKIKIKDLDLTTEKFNLEDFADCTDGSGECEISWNFEEVMKDKLNEIGSGIVTIYAKDPSNNEVEHEIVVEISQTSIEFKDGIREVAFEIYHDAILNDSIHGVGAFYDVYDENGNLILDPTRISWNLTEDNLRELGVYDLTLEVLDETKTELIGSMIVKAEVRDTIAPEAILVNGASTHYTIEADVFNSVENVIMYLNGISNIEELANVEENSGVYGYRFMYMGRPLTDDILREVGAKTITVQFFDYDIDGKELNYSYLNDALGNEITLVLNIVDTQPPVVIITNGVIDLEVVQNATKDMIEIHNYADISDNTGSYSWDLRVKGSQDDVMDYTNMLGKITPQQGVELELVVSDASGNTTYSDMLLIVSDTTPPVFEVLKDEETININPSVSELDPFRNIYSYVRISDNSGRYERYWDFDTVVGDASSIGEYYVTITAYDESGNIAEQVIKINVVDKVPPVIIIHTPIVEIEANEYRNSDEFEFDINLNSLLTVTDNSNGIIDVSFDYTNVNFGEIGDYDVVVTATDEAGNTTESVIVLKVIAGAPKVKVVEDVIVEDTMAITGNVITGVKIEVKDGKIYIEKTASSFDAETRSHLTMDNLLEFLTIKGETIISSSWDLSTLDLTALGSQKVTLNATNNFGKSVAEEIEFVIIQEYDSMLQLSADNFIDLEIDSNEVRDIAWFRSQYDVDNFVEFRLSGGTGTFDWDDSTLGAIDYLNVGSNVITVFIIDGHNQRHEVSINLNIIDTTVPVISITDPQTIEVNTQTSSDYDINTYVTATDNSGKPVVISWNLDTIVNFQEQGTYIVTVKAVDESGNETTAEITFNVEDTIAPVVVINSGMDTQTIEINSRDESQFNINSFVTATDNSGIAPTLEWDLETEVDFNTLGTYKVTVRATDNAGNVSQTVEINFIIVDTIAPTIDITQDGLDELIVEITTKSASDYDTWLDDYVTVTDNSGESITPTWDITGVDFNTFGTYIVEIKAIDSSNNETIRIVTFGVTDTTAPELTIVSGKDITTKEVYLSKPADFVIDDFVTCSDASTCTLSWDIAAVNFDFVGTYVVTIKAVDIYGNESRAEIVIEVVDTEAPVIDITRSEMSVSMDKYTAVDFRVEDFAKVTDNYDKSVSLMWEIESVDFNAEGRYDVRVTAIDDSGNEADEKIVTFIVRESNILVAEKTPFEIEVTQSPDAASYSIDTFFDITAEPGIVIASYTWDLSDDMLMTYGTKTVTITVEDGDGATEEIEVTLKVIDTTPPHVVNVIKSTETIELGSQTEYDALIPQDFIDASDNSNIVFYSWDLDAVVNLTEANSYTVMITLTDEHGNEHTENITIIVDDSVAPTLEFKDDFDRNNMVWDKVGEELSIIAGDKTQSEIDLWEIIDATDLSTTPLSISWDLTDLTNPANHSNVIITVEDASGNAATKTIKVNVLRATPILNSFIVDRDYEELTVNVDLTNINQAVSGLTITVYDTNNNPVGTAYTENNATHDNFTISHTFANLSTDTEYKIVLEYTYATLADNSNNVTVTEERIVNTLTYTENDVLGSITNVISGHNTLDVYYEITNNAHLLTGVKVVLRDAQGASIGEQIISINNQTGFVSFDSLTADTAYRVEIEIDYDFKDGQGARNKIADFKDVNTLAYTIHDVITDITGISHSKSTITVDYNILDQQNLLVTDGITAKIYLAEDMSLIESKDLVDLNGSVMFDNLFAGTTYVIVIETELDLKDNGPTVIKETGTYADTDTYKFEEIIVNIRNVQVEYYEISFDYEILDPSGLLVIDATNKLEIEIEGQVFELTQMSGSVKISDFLGVNNVTSDTEYDVQIHFTYNLKDGKPDIKNDTNAHGFIEKTKAYNVDQDLRLTSHSIASDTANIYVEYSLLNLDFIGDMATLAVTLRDLNGNEETTLLKDIFGDVASIPMSGDFALSDISGSDLIDDTDYEIEITIDYNLRDGNGVQTGLLLLDTTRIKTQHVQLSGYDIISTIDRAYTYLDVDFDIENTSGFNNLLDTFQIALLDSDGNVVPGYDYISFSAATGLNNKVFTGLFSDTEYTIVFRVENPNFGQDPTYEQYVDITRSISTRKYDTDLVNVEYDVIEGLSFLHLENIVITDDNINTEGIDYTKIMVVITYTSREGLVITQEVELGSDTHATFTNLQSDREIEVEFRLEYDLSDGNGPQTGNAALLRGSNERTNAYDFTFRIENDEVIVTGLNPAFTKDELIIFEEVEGYTVKYIEADAFYKDNISFSKLTIPESVDVIGENAFRNVSLSEVTVNSVFEIIPTVPRAISSRNYNMDLVIEDNAFRDNNIIIFDLTSSSYIGDGAFRNNSLTDVVLGDNITYVGQESFANNAIVSLVTGKLLSDEHFGANSFIGNEILNLTIGNIGFKSNSLGDSASVFNGTGFNLEFADSAVGEIGAAAWRMYNPSWAPVGLKVPLTGLVIGNGITKIGNRAFMDNQLANVEIGDSVTLIEEYAFQATLIETLTLGDSLEQIDQNAFINNDIKVLKLPESLIHIGRQSFSGNAISELIIPDNVDYVGDYAFQDNAMTKLQTGASLSDANFGSSSFAGNSINHLTIGNAGFKSNSLGDSLVVFDHTGFDLVFSDTAQGEIVAAAWREYNASWAPGGLRVPLTGLEIGDGITKIGNRAFMDNVLTEVFIGANVTEIEEYAFQGTHIEKLEIGNSLEIIGDSAFANNLIKEFIIPSHVKEIGASAFSGNQIAEVSFPDTVDYVGDNAFQNNLVTKVVLGKLLSDANFGSDTFVGNIVDDLIIGNIGFKANSLGHSGSVFAATGVDLTFADTAVGEIGEGTWRRYNAQYAPEGLVVPITSLYIGSGITSIGRVAFKENELKDIVIGENVTYIGDYAFQSTLVENLTLGNNLEEIGAVAFDDNMLRTVVFPDSLIKIGSSAFTNNLLTEVNIPASLVDIGSSAFKGNNITNITMTDTFKKIEAYVFENNDLTSFVIPAHLEEIGTAAFRNNKIETMTVPNTLNYISNNAFESNSIHTLITEKDVTPAVFGTSTFVRNEVANLSIGNIEIGQATFGDSGLVFASTGVNVTFEDTAEGRIADQLWRTVKVPILDLKFGIGISTLGVRAFADNTISTITMSDNLTYIDQYVFQNSSIQTVTLGDGVQVIERGAFQNSDLDEITFPESVELIGVDTFASNNLTTVTIPTNIQTVATRSFTLNPFTSLVVSDGVNSSVFNTNAFGGTIVVDENTSIDASIKNLTIGGDGFTNTTFATWNHVFDPTGVNITYTSGATSIPNNAWRNTTTATYVSKIISVDFGNIETIGSSAFDNSFDENVVDTVTIGSDVQTIGASAFINNNLIGINLNEGLETIGASAFQGNKLPSFQIPSTVTTIGDSAFESNLLTSLHLPDTVTVIGSNAFKNNLLMQDNVTLTAGITELSYGMFEDNVFTDLPALKNVTNIGFRSFMNNNIETLVIPDAVTMIGNNAFENNGMISLTTGVNFTEDNLGANTFINNEISELVLGNSTLGPISFGDSASVFAASGTTLEFASTATGRIADAKWRKHGTYAPEGIKVPITKLIIGTGITEIGVRTFQESIAGEIIMTDTITLIDQFAFTLTDVSALTLGQSIITIGRGAFQTANLDNLLIPESVEVLDVYSFDNNNLTSLRIPGNVQTVATYSFYRNPMTDLVLGDGLHQPSFSINSFGGEIVIDENTSIYSSIKNLTIGGDGFLKTTLGSASQVFDPTGVNVTYTSAASVIPTDAWRISSTAEEARYSVNNLVFEDGMTEIGSGAFRGNNINSLDLGNTITTVHSNAFNAGFDDTFTTLDLPGHVTDIGENSFGYSNIQTLILNEGLQTTGDNAFRGNAITAVTIPESIVTFGQNTFRDNNISTINFSQSLDVLAYCLFAENSLTELVVPETIKTLESRAFWANDITKLTTNTVMQSADYGAHAFMANEIEELIISNIDFNKDTLTSSNIGAADLPYAETGFKMIYADSAVGQIPATAWRMDTGVYNAVKVKEIHIGDGVTFIENRALIVNSNNPVLDIVTIGDSVTFIDEYAFLRTQIKHVELGANVLGTGRQAFDSSHIETITFNDKFEVIGIRAFQNNTKLVSMTLPASLTTISAAAFDNTPNIAEVTYLGGVVIDGNIFTSSPTFLDKDGNVIT